MKKRIVVIGGGASGLIAAGKAGENKNNSVILLEKNNLLGKKLLITGKCRCNLTNINGIDFLLKNTFGDKKFLYHALHNFSINMTMNFFENLGVKLKVERGGRVFPESDNSQDILNALKKYLAKNHVTLKLSSNVKNIIKQDNLFKIMLENNDFIECEKIILATGGKSYPLTGSNGDGYFLAKSFGHEIKNLYPSLVPIVLKENYDLQGLSLKNIELKLELGNKILYRELGELIFTHFGISGPIVLSASRFLINNYENAKIILDLKPGLDIKELDLRLQRDFKKYVNHDFKNALDDLLPKRLINVIIKLSGISPNKKVNVIKKSERQKLTLLLKNFVLTPVRSLGFEHAIITCGGVDTKEVNAYDMQSKLVKNLFFAGEILDLDALTGGFNLQIAFSTGYLAGQSV